MHEPEQNCTRREGDILLFPLQVTVVLWLKSRAALAGTKDRGVESRGRDGRGTQGTEIS